MPKPNKSDSFQLKADFLPITVLQLLRHETDLLQNHLDDVAKKAPHFFANAPIILDFSAVRDAQDEMDVKAICDLLRQYHMQPIAARGLSKQDTIPLLSENAAKTPQPVKNKAKETTRIPAKIITKPVRAGTQVYAKDTDLIILASVNAGAEVIADGNIHIYAPLRGRALAGASGDTDARIFCKQLEAELVSIAGHYLLNEKMKIDNNAQNLVQIYFANNKLTVEII